MEKENVIKAESIHCGEIQGSGGRLGTCNQSHNEPLVTYKYEYVYQRMLTLN